MTFTPLLIEEIYPTSVALIPVSFISVCVASLALLRLFVKEQVLWCSKCYPSTALRNLIDLEDPVNKTTTK